MTEQYEEKRRFSRIFYNANAQLTSGDKTEPCQVIDLSLKGCLLKLPEDWSSNESERHKLLVTLSDECEIEMELLLTYHNKNQGGFYCEQIDIDSISQLKRLIELNLGDSQLLERDLDALAHAS